MHLCFSGRECNHTISGYHVPTNHVSWPDTPYTEGQYIQDTASTPGYTPPAFSETAIVLVVPAAPSVAITDILQRYYTPVIASRLRLRAAMSKA